MNNKILIRQSEVINRPLLFLFISYALKNFILYNKTIHNLSAVDFHINEFIFKNLFENLKL